jgi:hypothetical protein
MSRTLLPVFSKYSLGLNLDAKEPAEDFSFLHNDRRDYEMFRDALDRIPGSREYLKDYERPEKGLSFFDPMGNKIMCAAGGHHSGASAAGLGWSYKLLLNDWDGWVKNVKLNQAKRQYKDAQIERPSTWQFANSMTEEGKKKGIDALRSEFNLSYSDEEIALMVRELITEWNENSRLQILEEEEDRFNDRILVLEHHHKYPQRWDDCGEGQLKSHLFGSIHGITEAMFVAMEKKHPDYRAHIRNIITRHVPRCACIACHQKRIANGTDGEYSAWVRAEAAAVLSRPPRAAETDKLPDCFVKDLFKAVQGVNYDDKCPHGLPFYACMPCSH